MAERHKTQAAGTGEANPPPSGLTAEQFEALPEFRRFKTMMWRILRVPKAELDKRVQASKEASSRRGNPGAPGRKSEPKRSRCGPPTTG
jgi:hypothetical protein